MSETPKQERMDDQELERHLLGLRPVTLRSDFVDELMRDCENVQVAKKGARETHIHWKRLIPLSLAACLVMVTYVSYQFDSSRSADSASIAGNDQSETPVVETVTPLAPVLDSGIVPVSAEGFLIRTSSGGIIESENGPVEELNLEYQDSYHWRDPATNTNIRFFTPRKERVLVPVITN